MRKTALNSVYELAKKNNKVIFIGSDLGPGVLDEMKKQATSISQDDKDIENRVDEDGDSDGDDGEGGGFFGVDG